MHRPPMDDVIAHRVNDRQLRKWPLHTRSAHGLFVHLKNAFHHFLGLIDARVGQDDSTDWLGQSGYLS